ncbi:uncharacterized protein DUF3990 [Sinobaca qinghaiensis]|uniref:Uncharacterized protein DUF3990 n=1 Tax=Sinobaca qinghaiensis TaxID=342944 RepID=A0A419VU32_9BACL|nr:DUF3990 domain-containing protein [Sinobaca qinghaiensis]RKD84124.1 uncharacterized protein DUF3990 [Sinobaca qinghaiensis]
MSYFEEFLKKERDNLRSYKVWYHGTNLSSVNKIKEDGIIFNYSSQIFSDFGKGFYLTYDKKQAEIWANKKAEIDTFNENEEDSISAVLEVELDLSEENILIVNDFDEEWARIILKNRSKYYKDFDFEVDDNFPLIFGRMADKVVGRAVRTYEKKRDIEAFLKLSVREEFKTQNQLVVKSQEICDKIKIIT